MIDTTSKSSEATAETFSGSVASILTLLKSYKEVTSDSTRLVLADTRLAITSLVQILLLSLIAMMAVFCLWLLILAGLGLWLINGLGVSPAGLIGIYIVLHVVFIVLLAVAIRSTNSGLRFTATRELIPRAKPGYTNTPLDNQTSNTSTSSSYNNHV